MTSLIEKKIERSKERSVLTTLELVFKIKFKFKTESLKFKFKARSLNLKKVNFKLKSWSSR